MLTKLRLLRVLVVLVFIGACIAIPKIDNPVLFVGAAILATAAAVIALIRLGRPGRAGR
jgi:hypothetical protein